MNKPRKWRVASGEWRVLALMLSASLFAGCTARVKHVTNLPAGVTEKQAQDYDAAVANLHKIATSTSAFRQAVIDLRNQGMITNDHYYVTVLQSVSRVDQLQLAATGVLRDSPEYFNQAGKGQVLAYVREISGELKTLESARVIGPTAAQAQITTLLNEITAATNLVIALTS